MVRPGLWRLWYIPCKGRALWIQVIGADTAQHIQCEYFLASRIVGAGYQSVLWTRNIAVCFIALSTIFWCFGIVAETHLLNCEHGVVDGIVVCRRHAQMGGRRHVLRGYRSTRQKAVKKREGILWQSQVTVLWLGRLRGEVVQIVVGSFGPLLAHGYQCILCTIPNAGGGWLIYKPSLRQPGDTPWGMVLRRKLCVMAVSLVYPIGVLVGGGGCETMRKIWTQQPSSCIAWQSKNVAILMLRAMYCINIHCQHRRNIWRRMIGVNVGSYIRDTPVMWVVSSRLKFLPRTILSRLLCLCEHLRLLCIFPLVKFIMSARREPVAPTLPIVFD